MRIAVTPTHTCPDVEEWSALLDQALDPQTSSVLSIISLRARRAARNWTGTRPAATTSLRFARQDGDPTLAPVDSTLAEVMRRLHGAWSGPSVESLSRLTSRSCGPL